MICSKTFLWSLQNSDLSSQQFGIILAEAQCPCVQSPFSIFYSTGQVSPDQWEGSNLHNWPIASEENAFDNCMRGAMTAVTGVSSELNSDPFPAWSSHSHLVNASQQFWPIRGSDISDWAGNDVWDVHCRVCSSAVEMLQVAACEICLCHLSQLSSDGRVIAQGENGDGNPRPGGNYKIISGCQNDSLITVFLPIRSQKSGRGQ